MSKLLEDLCAEALFKAVHAMAEFADKKIAVVITSTRRTQEEQEALHKQGRFALDVVNQARAAAGLRPISATENGYTVTNCDGVKVKSRHQGGRAIDIVPRGDKGQPVWPSKSDPRWGQIAEVMKRAGFVWGGDWVSFPDLPHYEIV